MAKQRVSARNLTDEEVLKEFVRRFQCDGAVLIYLDSSMEYGFGRWLNKQGQHWVDSLFSRIKQRVELTVMNSGAEGGTIAKLSN